MNDEFVKIGEEIEGRSPSVFELVIEDHIEFVDPKYYDLSDTKYINPKDYFITSGDAVEKTKALKRDMLNLIDELQYELCKLIQIEHCCTFDKATDLYHGGLRPKSNRLNEYKLDVVESIAQIDKLLDNLKKARGGDCFLETEWDSHRLLCIPKNPRMRKD